MNFISESICLFDVAMAIFSSFVLKVFQPCYERVQCHGELNWFIVIMDLNRVGFSWTVKDTFRVSTFYVLYKVCRYSRWGKVVYLNKIGHLSYCIFWIICLGFNWVFNNHYPILALHNYDWVRRYNCISWLLFYIPYNMVTTEAKTNEMLNCSSQN